MAQPSSMENRVGVFFAGEGLRDFEIAARGGIHADILAVGFERQAVQMLRHQVLRQADIVQQRTCRANRNGVFFAVQTEAAQILAAEIFRQQFFPASAANCHAFRRVTPDAV